MGGRTIGAGFNPLDQVRKSCRRRFCQDFGHHTGKRMGSRGKGRGKIASKVAAKSSVADDVVAKNATFGPLEFPSFKNSDEIRLNLGGEGEMAGYIDVNPLIGNRRTMEEIIKKNPTGGFVMAGAEALPFADNSVSEIVALRLPSVVIDELGPAIANEIIRVLKPGGSVMLTCATKGSWYHFAERGFKVGTGGYSVTFTKSSR